MDRREFVKTGIAASLAAGMPAVAGPAKSKKRPPNVLYVFSDQHRAASMPGEPFCEALVAPTLDAFRRKNFSMDTCVSNYPLCTPYRGILMTGRYSCQSGLTYNATEGGGDEAGSGGVEMSTSETTLTKTFKANGYHTGYVGKWHLGGDGAFTPKGPRRFDIDEWHTWSNTARHYASFTFDPESGARIAPQGWSASSMTDQAVGFVKAQPKGANAPPWLLILSWNPPHPPFDPPKPDLLPYPLDKLKTRPNFQVPSEYAKKGKAMRSKEQTEKGIMDSMQGYYGGITGIDIEFERLLKALDDSGQAENTIVVYTSDHGEMMGSQGRVAKKVPFEESCRVPFAVRYPGVTVPGGSSKALFGAIDIYPTVCGLAGIPVPPHCAGKDLSPIMRGKPAKAPDIVFMMSGDARLGGGNGKSKKPATEADAEAQADAKRVPIYRGARTDTHTYAVTQEGRWLLYDNVADPYQMKNLAQDPAHAELMASLDVRIKEWLKLTGDQFVYPKFD